MLDQLSKQDCALSHALKELISRIQERRNEYSDALQFLHDVKELLNAHDQYGIFNQSLKAEINKKLIELEERLFLLLLRHQVQKN